jgi:hypothetical protein
MSRFQDRGAEIRAAAKCVVFDYMRSVPECQPGREGMRLSPIFNASGLDWGP